MTVNNFSRKDIAQAFAGTGGVKRLIRWAKKNDHNYAQFVSMFKNEISTIITAGSAAQPEQSGDKQLRAVFENAFRGAINGARRKNIDGVSHDVPKQIDGVIDARPSARHDISDTSRDTPAPPQPKPDGLKPPKPPPDFVPLHDGVFVLPANIRKKHYTASGAHITELFNEITIVKPPARSAHHSAVAVANEQSSSIPVAPSPEPSATELFLEWNGRSRPQWSAPHGWSGS